MIQITYKENLFRGKPYPVATTEEYLEMLNGKKSNIFNGDLGVYLGRMVKYGEQELYFPFIDIDAAADLNEDDKIENAIHNTYLTCRILEDLNILDHFLVIATGNTGFRMLSNYLLNKTYYLAFVDFINEITHIHDKKPTEDLEMPHQIFVYKGVKQHNKNKNLVDRHSTIVPAHEFLAEKVTADYYKEITEGKANPDEIIDFMNRFFNFNIITDINSLGPFGAKLKEYAGIRKSIKVNSFDLSRFRDMEASYSLNEMQNRLKDKNILCSIEKRGNTKAISFRNLPCPICGKTGGNAVAYPPKYFLKCFRQKCEAKNGLPMIKWVGISNGYKEPLDKEPAFSLNQPEVFEEIEEARENLKRELISPDNILFLVTPGVGKTYVTLKILSEEYNEENNNL